MNKSSRFASLSGLSGILVGIYALIAAFFSYRTVYGSIDSLGWERIILIPTRSTNLLVIASITLVLSIGTVIFLTTRQTKKEGQQAWDFHTKRLLFHLALPLLAGGIICLVFLSQGYISLLAPFTLVFYGLALVNASKFTLPQIQSLGILELCLGLISFLFLELSIAIWAIGFGLLHMIYGVMMHLSKKP